MAKNILFVTWDGPQTNYVEGLFMPIYAEIEKENPNYKFHYLQFTWGNNQKAQQEASTLFHIPYASVPIKRKPVKSLASFLTLFKGHRHIQYYVKKWNIDILMPRSLFPAFMVFKTKLKLPILYDADGLPIEERIDFANLKRGGLIHQFYQGIEKKAIRNTDLVITRSQKAIQYHIDNYKPQNTNKFYRVSNGRDVHLFKPNTETQQLTRDKLKLRLEQTLFVYAGSFGPQYGWDEMLQIFLDYKNTLKPCHFLFLTGSPENVIQRIPSELKSYFTVLRVPFQEIPTYLNAADIAFAIREPSFSMQGVAPIKLGEYLLMGIPTIASKGIGDTTELLSTIPGTFLYDHKNPPSSNTILEFIENLKDSSKNEIRNKALNKFSLEATAKSYLCALKNLK